MLVNKKFIEETIALRVKDNDPVREFAFRTKNSSIDAWSDFELYSLRSFKKVYNDNIDGVKLKFRYTTLTINGRHRSS